MAPRVKTPEISKASAINPVAAPVDSYVRPPDPPRSNLHDIARGLAAFDSGLSSYLGKRDAEKDEADRLLGEAEFYKNNQVGFAEGVRNGSIPSNSSPQFVEAYKRAQGNLQGIKLRERFNSEYLQWEGRNANDPEAFQAFLADFVTRNVNTDDVDILRGLNPHLHQLAADGISKFGEERTASTYNGSVDTHAAISGEMLDQATVRGLETEQGVDYSEVFEDILSIREAALATGIRKEDYDKKLVDAIVSKAIEHEDPKFLEFLDEVLPEYDTKLGSLPEFRDAKRYAMEKLESDAASDMLARERIQEKIDKEHEESIVRSVVDILAGDPTSNIPEEVIAEWSKYDPTARTKLVEYRKKLLSGEELEDPRDVLHIERLIQEGSTTQDMLDLVESGVIKDVSTLRTAIDRIEKRSKAKLEGKGILTGQTAKRFLRTIKERTTPDDINRMFAPEGLTDEGLEATRDFEEMLIGWEEANPDATLVDRENAINDIGELILKRIIPDDRQYVSPEDAERIRADQQQQQQESSAGPPQDEPQAGTLPLDTETTDEADVEEPFEDEEAENGFGSPVSPAAREAENESMKRLRAAPDGSLERDEDDRGDVATQYSGEEPPSLESLPEDVRTRIETDAKKLGMTPEEYNMGIWQKIRESFGKTPNADKINYAPDSGDKSEGQKRIESIIDDAVAEGESSEAPLSTTFVQPLENPDLNPKVHARYRGKRLPVVIRNNNMGAVSITGSNINRSWAAKQAGFVGVSKRPKNEGGYYAKYATPEHGVGASSKLLERYGQRGTNTAGKIVRKWSVDKRAHATYARTLTKYLNEAGFKVDVDTKLDLSNADVRVAILKAKSAHESGFGEPIYADHVFERGAHYRFGGKVTAGGGDLDHVHTASDRGYDPDIDNVKAEVQQKVIAVQKAFGQKLPVVSGYRDPARNKKSKGAKKSEHMHGNAVDISVRGMPVEERVRLIKLASENGFTGIGVYDNSLHFDVGKRRYWGPNFRGTSLPKWAKAAIQEHMSRRA